MARRVPLAALLLYLALDCANPLMPGAVSFDPDASVEATGGARLLQRLALVDVAATPDVGLRPDAELRPARRSLTSSTAVEAPVSPRARSALYRSTPPGSESD